MIYKIVLNPNWTEEQHKKFAEKIESIDGQCPCVNKFARTEDTKCMCKEFREMEYGICHCGRFIKIPLAVLD